MVTEVMMKNRLHLYNSKITIRLYKKEKDTIKKNAYKNNLTLSDYIRQIITIDNRTNNIHQCIKKADKCMKDIYKAKVCIGRDD